MLQSNQREIGDGLFVREEEAEWLVIGGKGAYVCVSVCVYVYGVYVKKKRSHRVPTLVLEQDITYPL